VAVPEEQEVYDLSSAETTAIPPEWDGGAVYTLERSARLLFWRERQLDHERDRSEALLLNILPRAIAERLKQRADPGTGLRGGNRELADEHADVAVPCADLADSP
jgi:hypothetical protein